MSAEEGHYCRNISNDRPSNLTVVSQGGPDPLQPTTQGSRAPRFAAHSDHDPTTGCWNKRRSNRLPAVVLTIIWSKFRPSTPSDLTLTNCVERCPDSQLALPDIPSPPPPLRWNLWSAPGLVVSNDGHSDACLPWSPPPPSLP
jgi:hypothetical protein